MSNASKPLRLLLFIVATACMVAIWLTGFDKVHWFAYVIPAVLYFAALSGFCLGLLITGKILAAFGVRD